jgi:hypothetical protein
MDVVCFHNAMRNKTAKTIHATRNERFTRLTCPRSSACVWMAVRCVAMIDESTARNWRHRLSCSLASAPFNKYRLISERVELSVHCEKIARGVASSIAINNTVQSIVFSLNFPFCFVQCDIFKLERFNGVCVGGMVESNRLVLGRSG